MLEAPDPPSTKEARPTPPARTHALLGITCLVVVAADLGLPGLNPEVGLQLLLTVVGYQLAKVVRSCNRDADRRVPMVLGLAARALPTVLLVTCLVALYQAVPGGLGGGAVPGLLSAVTFTANIVPFATNGSMGALSHLWAVALVAQLALAAPWLLTAGRHRIGLIQRAGLLFAAAGVLTVTRMIFLAVVGPSSGSGAWLTPPAPTLAGAIAVWTSLDALLLGMAIGTLPLANLHRHPTTRLVAPAAGGALLLLVTPSIGPPALDIGLRLSLATALVGVILSSEAISGLPERFESVLTNPWPHRLGSRTLGLYLWHLPFAYSLTDGRPYEWAGPITFTLIVALTLAAATTTYRSIEIPAQLALASLASRWYRPDAVFLPAAEPQRNTWIRWDEVSLDRLPIPTRRRRRTAASTDRSRAPSETGGSVDHGPLGRRLWQTGDRSIDLRAVRRSRVGTATAREADAGQADRQAATG